tara:strand:+ start:620 stop:1087 length:468 start_codon:yes stop_codon:yes gene_type:complete
MTKKMIKGFYTSKVKRFGSRLGCPNGVSSYGPGKVRTTPERRKESLSKYNNTEKRKADMKLYYAKNEEYSYGRGIVSKYGIDLVEYNKLLVKQKHSCYICKKHKDTFKNRLCVDHNHKTGKVRGLLCASCNYVLGHSKDSVRILKTMIKYLKENK